MSGFKSLIGVACSMEFSSKPEHWRDTGSSMILIEKIDMPMIKIKPYPDGGSLWININIVKTVREA